MTAVVLPASIDDFCNDNNWTYDELAESLGVSRATIFNWKKDSRGLSRIVLLALAVLKQEPPLGHVCASDSFSIKTPASGSPSGEEIEGFCKRNDYTYDLLSDELKVSRATIFNWKNTSRREVPRVALLALAALEARPELRTVKKPSAEHAGRKQYRRGSLVKPKE
jgi:DNA-binding transcriptional regulator YiaG